MQLKPETVNDLRFFGGVVLMITLAWLSNLVYFGVIRIVLVLSQ